MTLVTSIKGELHGGFRYSSTPDLYIRRENTQGIQVAALLNSLFGGGGAEGYTGHEVMSSSWPLSYKRSYTIGIQVSLLQWESWNLQCSPNLYVYYKGCSSDF
jgi:hypothetical protein